MLLQGNLNSNLNSDKLNDLTLNFKVKIAKFSMCRFLSASHENLSYCMIKFNFRLNLFFFYTNPQQVNYKQNSMWRVVKN
jgi:hypothetical protein